MAAFISFENSEAMFLASGSEGNIKEMSAARPFRNEIPASKLRESDWNPPPASRPIKRSLPMACNPDMSAHTS